MLRGALPGCRPVRVAPVLEKVVGGVRAPLEQGSGWSVPLATSAGVPSSVKQAGQENSLA